jgi:hypothetical protein
MVLLCDRIGRAGDQIKSSNNSLFQPRPTPTESTKNDENADLDLGTPLVLFLYTNRRRLSVFYPPL